MSKLSLSLLVLTLLVATTACGPKAEAPAPEAAPEAAEEAVEVVEEALVAVAVLTPRADTEVAGTVTFTQTAEGVVVVANVSGVENLASVRSALSQLAGDVDVRMVNIAHATNQLDAMRFESRNPTFLVSAAKKR